MYGTGQDKPRSDLIEQHPAIYYPAQEEHELEATYTQQWRQA